MSKGIAYTPHDDILEGGRLLDEGGLVLFCEEVALVDEFLGQLVDYRVSWGRTLSAVRCNMITSFSFLFGTGKKGKEKKGNLSKGRKIVLENIPRKGRTWRRI